MARSTVLPLFYYFICTTQRTKLRPKTNDKIPPLVYVVNNIPGMFALAKGLVSHLKKGRRNLFH